MTHKPHFTAEEDSRHWRNRYNSLLSVLEQFLDYEDKRKVLKKANELFEKYENYPHINASD